MYNLKFRVGFQSSSVLASIQVPCWLVCTQIPGTHSLSLYRFRHQLFQH
jgi:hypothetical protein